MDMYFRVNMNGTEAYQRLHPKTDRDVCRSEATKNIAKPSIQQKISSRLDAMAMPKNEILARLGGMARASTLPFIRVTEDGFTYFDFNHPDAMEYMYLIKKIKTKRTRKLLGSEPWEDEWVEVELHDAQAALEKLARYHRLDKGEEDNSTNIIALSSLPAESISPTFLTVYRDIRNNGHAEYLLKGGRGSTKSSFTSLAFIYLLINNPQVHGLALRQVANTLRDSVYSQLLWAIQMLGLEERFKCTTSPLEMEYTPTRQKIFFRGADKPEKIKSIKPVFGYIGLLWFEELDQFRGAEGVRNIEQSVLRGGDLTWEFKTYNPPKTNANWVNKYALITKNSQYQHHSTYLDVPTEWLGKTFLNEAEHLQEINEDAYNHEYLGIVTGTGGMVFENLELREITDEEIATFERPLRGIDWGYFPDPFSFGIMHYDSARMILYIYGEFRTNRTGNRKAYDELVRLGLINRTDLIVADSAEPKSVADFREYGANIIGAEKGADSVDYSMKWLQSLSKIVIDPRRAPAHAQEFAEYELEKDKDGEYISSYPDKNNHGIDDVRYATNLHWRKRGK